MKKLSNKFLKRAILFLLVIVLGLSYTSFSCYNSKALLIQQKADITAQRDSMTYDFIRLVKANYAHYEKCAFIDKNTMYVDSYGCLHIKNGLTLAVLDHEKE